MPVFCPLYLVLSFNKDNPSTKMHDDSGRIYTRVKAKSPFSQSTQTAKVEEVGGGDLMS